MLTDTPKINNAFYNDLGERWYTDDTNPVALLRAEGHLKLDYIQRLLNRLHVPGNARILDVGCGGGFLTNPLAASGYQMTGVDLSTSSLVTAKAHASNPLNPVYHIADAYNLPETNQSFDVVLMMDFLEHVDNPDLAIAEAARALRPGGIFVFHTFNRTMIANLLVIKAVELVTRDCPEHMHVFNLFITPDELRILCQQNGLTVQEFKGVRPNFWSAPFWSTVSRRRLHPDLRFTYSRSLAVGYIGYALKTLL
jgi:2-polyprenyl-6-hydroxyphenyl methylase/3-demethylubiquinone-9 3-methyltransferase